MKNKLRTLCSVLLAATLVTVQVNAAVLNELVAEYSAADNSVTVSAVVDNSAGDNAGDIVVKLIAGTDAQLDSDSGLLVAADVIDAAGKGTLVHKIGLKPDLAEGVYNVYLSGAGVESADAYFWYYKDATIESKTQLVTSASSSEMSKTLFEDKLIGGEYYDLADELSLKNSFYVQSSDCAIARIVANETENIANWKELKAVFNTASVMAAFENGNTAIVTDAEYNFKAELFDSADPASEIQQIYEADGTITAEGKQNMINMLSGKSWSKVDDFEKDLAKHVLYTAVYNATTEGHIPQLITELASLCGYNASGFNALSADDRNAVASAVLLSNAQSPEAMLSAIDTAVAGISGGNSGNSGNGGSSGGGGGGGGGASIGVSTGYADELKEQSNVREDAYMTGFTDISDYSWAKDAIVYLSDNGIVSGTGNNTYTPARSITREEFAKMLALVMDYDTTEVDSEFSDVSVHSWYYGYVSALAVNGVTEGMGNGKFGVGTPVTRQECCTLIWRALGSESGSAGMFTDGDSIADWAEQAVGSMAEKGIVKGYEDGSFKPENNITRAEAAVMFYRMIIGGVAG